MGFAAVSSLFQPLSLTSAASAAGVFVLLCSVVCCSFLILILVSEWPAYMADSYTPVRNAQNTEVLEVTKQKVANS